jgi:hypothetical protein
LVNSAVAVFLLLTAFVVLNLVATVCLMQSAVYSATQKALQLVLVWVIPLVGSIFVLSVWAHDRKSASRDPVLHGEGPWLPGIGPENEHRHPGDSIGESGSHDGHGGDAGGSGH